MADKEDAAKAADTAKKDRAAEKADREKAAADQKDILKRLSDIATGQGAGSSSKLDWKDRVKARKQRDSMIKGDRSLKGDLKKNVKDMKDNFLGGIDATINETFGSGIGGFISSLTTGMFKRGDDAKEALALQQTSNEQGEDILASFDEKIAGGAVGTKGGKGGKGEDDDTDKVVSALGGVAEASSSGYEDIELGLWTKMEDHLFFMRSNMETAEDRRERLRKQRGGAVIKKGAKGAKGDDGGGGILEWLGMTHLFKKIGVALIGLRALFGKGLFGKGGLFRNLKVAFMRQFKNIFGKGALKTLMKGMKLGARFGTRLTAFAGSTATALIAPIIDGIFGFIDAEKWGVSKTSGVLGGILGGSEGGFMNAFMNAGKWALIGVKIGTPGGPPGMIAGGLIGAAIGGILGWIGGDVIAKKLDIFGAWLADAFHTVFIKPFQMLFNAIVPDWVKGAGLEWSDLMPPALNKLFAGEYFTIDFPKFQWYDLFPKFLVDFFKNAGKNIVKANFKWTDLMPPFLKKFFAGQYAIGKDEFEWRDLLPPFITKIIDLTKTTWTETWDAASWKSLLPNWMVKVIDHDWIKPTGTFEWTDLVPTFISKLITAGEVEGTNPVTGAFEWTRLLPSWMGTAWGAVVSGAETVMAAEFNWTNLLPDWMVGAWASTKGIIKRDVGNFDWTRLLPGFIADLFPNMGPLTPNRALAALKEFDWMSLLPQFMRDILEGGKVLAGEMGNIGDKISLMFEDLIDSIIQIIPSALRPATAKEKRAEAEKEAAEKAAEEAEDLKKAEGARKKQISWREQEVAKESKKIKASEGGKDTYWGSEESGRKDSQERIDKLNKEIETLQALAPKSKKVTTKKESAKALKEAGGTGVKEFDKSAHMKGAVVTTMPKGQRGEGVDISDMQTGDGVKDFKPIEFDKSAHMQGAVVTTMPKGQRGEEAKQQNGGEPAGLHGKHGIPENEKIRAFLVDALATEEGKGAKTRNLFAIQDLKSYIQAEAGLEDLDMSNRRNYLASPFATRHQGGPIKQSGSYELLAGEMVWDQQAVAAFGKLLNQFAYEKVGTEAGGVGSGSTVIDSSTQQVITNNTIVNSPEPTGPMLPGAGRDTAVSHFRHAA